MKNFLVGGGAGYIGSVVVNNLIDLGYKVIVIDNLSTGHKFLVNKKVNFFFLDINNLKKLNSFFKKFESVINKKIFINFFSRVKSDITKIYSNNKYLKFLFPLWKRKFGIIDSIKSALA